MAEARSQEGQHRGTARHPRFMASENAVLLRMMRVHGQCLFGCDIDDHANHMEAWQEILADVNLVGEQHHTINTVRRYAWDLIRNTQMHAWSLAQETSRTGGGAMSLSPLSADEEFLISLKDMEGEEIVMEGLLQSGQGPILPQLSRPLQTEGDHVTVAQAHISATPPQPTVISEEEIDVIVGQRTDVSPQSSHDSPECVAAMSPAGLEHVPQPSSVTPPAVGSEGAAYDTDPAERPSGMSDTLCRTRKMKDITLRPGAR